MKQNKQFMGSFFHIFFSHNFFFSFIKHLVSHNKNCDDKKVYKKIKSLQNLKKSNCDKTQNSNYEKTQKSNS